MSCKIPGFMGFVHPPSYGSIPEAIPGLAGFGAGPVGSGVQLGLPGAVGPGVAMSQMGQGIPFGEAGVAGQGYGQGYDFPIFIVYIFLFFPT